MALANYEKAEKLIEELISKKRGSNRSMYPTFMFLHSLVACDDENEDHFDIEIIDDFRIKNNFTKWDMYEIDKALFGITIDTVLYKTALIESDRRWEREKDIDDFPF